MSWNFGNFRRSIIKHREEQGWSLLKAARKAGISDSMLRQLEKGERCPSVKTLAAIARAYETTPDELMGGW